MEEVFSQELVHGRDCLLLTYGQHAITTLPDLSMENGLSWDEADRQAIDRCHSPDGFNRSAVLI